MFTVPTWHSFSEILGFYWCKGPMFCKFVNRFISTDFVSLLYVAKHL